ncbi:MAG: ATP-grasp domain-containing protein [Gammaproteobacteria bacterium]|nr:ATP-grasp domain-containing protein [Gammaproteobacteria bacterium]
MCLKHLLLVTPPQSYRLAAYLQAASSLGAKLTIASDGRHSLIKELADGIQIDFSDTHNSLQKIITAAQLTPFDGVVASDDATVELAAEVALALGLPFNSTASARLTRRKDLARQVLRSSGVPVPDHWLIDLESPLQPQLGLSAYPLVLKPISLSASRGVIRVDNIEEAVDACEVIRKIIADQPDPEERQTILAEAYLDGVEVALEGFLHQGRFESLALFDKPDPLTGPYFEETYYVTPSRLPSQIQGLIEQTVADACLVYGLQQGPVHAELRVNLERGKVWILEVAGRTIGGECGRALDAGLSQPLEKMVLASAMGESLAVKRDPGAAGVLMIPIPRPGVLRRVGGQAAALDVDGITDLRVTAPAGHELKTLPDASSYLGFIFARGERPEQVEQALRRAHGLLDIQIDPLLSLTPV